MFIAGLVYCVTLRYLFHILSLREGPGLQSDGYQNNDLDTAVGSKVDVQLVGGSTRKTPGRSPSIPLLEARDQSARHWSSRLKRACTRTTIFQMPIAPLLRLDLTKRPPQQRPDSWS